MVITQTCIHARNHGWFGILVNDGMLMKQCLKWLTLMTLIPNVFAKDHFVMLMKEWNVIPIQKEKNMMVTQLFLLKTFMKSSHQTILFPAHHQWLNVCVTVSDTTLSWDNLSSICSTNSSPDHSLIRTKLAAQKEANGWLKNRFLMEPAVGQ